MLLSWIALIAWIVIILLIIAIKVNRDHGQKEISLSRKITLILCFSFLVFFYFPHKNLFPYEGYAPVHIVGYQGREHYDVFMDDNESAEFLQKYNQIYVSRSAWRTLSGYTRGGDQFIEFLGRRARNAAINLYPEYRKIAIRKNGQKYYVWNYVDIVYKV